MSTDKQIFFVVGDPKLNKADRRKDGRKLKGPPVPLEGTFVRRLENIKPLLMAKKMSYNWTLVLRIHGNRMFLANVTYALKGEIDKESYNAAKIKRIFGQDKDFVQWRKTYGPKTVSLQACQVEQALEKVVIKSLTKGGEQSAQGLGTACRPDLVPYFYEYKSYKSKVFVKIRTWAQYNKLPQYARNEMLEKLKKENREWGYLGAPPVPETLVLHYYFDEEPKGAWISVNVSYKYRSTKIPFYNRASHESFWRVCKFAAGH